MHTHMPPAQAQRYLHEQAQAFGAYFDRTPHGDIIYHFNLAMVFGLPPSQMSASTVMTPAERAWAYAEQNAARLRHQQAQRKAANQQANQQRAEAIAQQIKALAAADTLPEPEPLDPQTLPTVRGRAQAAPEHVQTIDVSAINE